MAEGKITLPAIFALNKTQDKEMLALAKKVKNRSISTDEITVFIEFTKKNGGIEYAEDVMEKLHAEALSFVDKYVDDSDIANALRSYLDYIIERKL